jgi:hypothetical protein
VEKENDAVSLCVSGLEFHRHFSGLRNDIFLSVYKSGTFRRFVAFSNVPALKVFYFVRVSFAIVSSCSYPGTE